MCWRPFTGGVPNLGPFRVTSVVEVALEEHGSGPNYCSQDGAALQRDRHHNLNHNRGIHISMISGKLPYHEPRIVRLFYALFM